MKDDSTPLTELTLGDIRAEFGNMLLAPPIPLSEVGQFYDYKAKAERFLVLHKITEIGPILQNLLDGPWPTRLLYLSRDADSTSEDLALLHYNADLIDADPHTMQRLAHLVGYPILRLQELDGMTNPDVMVIAPINRRVARHGAAISLSYARDIAKSWAFGVTSTANDQDELNEALAHAARLADEDH